MPGISVSLPRPPHSHSRIVRTLVISTSGVGRTFINLLLRKIENKFSGIPKSAVTEYLKNVQKLVNGD